MKQYVLDPPAALSSGMPPIDAAEAAPPRSPGRWRWIVLILVFEPLALAALYLFLSGGGHADTDVRPLASATAVAPAPAFAVPRPVEPAPAPSEEPVDRAEATSRISRISHERGRYVVDLHSAPLGSALEMLSTATKARVTGGDILAGSALRLTRSAVTATPQEAWQAVFSEVASFAITCAANACDVRFVALTKSDADPATASQPGRSPGQAPMSAGAIAVPAPDPLVAAPAWGAAAAPGPEPTSSDN